MHAHELIVSPFLDEHLVLRPGDSAGIKIKGHHYLELQQRASADALVPAWLMRAAHR